MSRPGGSSSCSSYHKRHPAIIASRILESEMSAAKKQKLDIPEKLHECPHCEKLLTRRTFKKHQQLYCRSDGTWITSRHDQLSQRQGIRIATYISIANYSYNYIYIYIYIHIHIAIYIYI